MHFSSPPIASTYFLNYSAIGIKYALEVLQYQRIGIIEVGEKELESGLLQIIEKDIENKHVVFTQYQNNWKEIETEMMSFQPQLIFVHFHCEISTNNPSIDIESLASQLCQFTYNESPFQCQILTLFKHGIIQDVFYDNYRSIIR